MIRASAKDTAIVIPARNEESRIGACLTALAGQGNARVTVILVVNNTIDRTSGTARGIAARRNLDLTVLERTLPSHEGVGTARRIVRALRAAGRRVRHVDDVSVQASCRLTGRAAGGMSDALKSRIRGMDYLIGD